jgi:hypothetical protein
MPRRSLRRTPQSRQPDQRHRRRRSGCCLGPPRGQPAGLLGLRRPLVDARLGPRNNGYNERSRRAGHRRDAQRTRMCERLHRCGPPQPALPRLRPRPDVQQRVGVEASATIPLPPKFSPSRKTIFTLSDLHGSHSHRQRGRSDGERNNSTSPHPVEPTGVLDPEPYDKCEPNPLIEPDPERRRPCNLPSRQNLASLCPEVVMTVGIAGIGQEYISDGAAVPVRSDGMSRWLRWRRDEVSVWQNIEHRALRRLPCAACR